MSTHLLRIEKVTDLQLVPELASLADLALQPDGFHAFANAYGPKSIYEETVDRLTAAIEDPRSYVFRAVLARCSEDGTISEELVGLTQWYVGYIVVPKTDPFRPRVLGTRPGSLLEFTEIATANTTEEARMVEMATKIEPGTSPNPFDAVAREVGNSHIRAIRGTRHIYLRRMVVHPNHQRKGIGQKLLQWGMDLADREKIVGWLFARPAASKLYEKNGWRAVDSIAVDVPGMVVAPLVSMLRKPQPLGSPSA